MKFFFSLIPFFSSAVLFSQSFNLSGRITGSEEEALPLASVVILNADDSIMHSFSVSDNEGFFHLKRIKPGSYLLQTAFVGYQTNSQSITVNDKDLDVGVVKLQEKSELLDEVSITADRIPILVKGDTIEYNAAAFKTNPNSSVEDLLKRLPGVEVDQDGNIKAQGEKVGKVLVDGKEFFGEDPKIATKNLPSDAINKVQVFDKMSEMAEFTGVDDGQRAKTINLSLKNDKKNGFFGKLSGGYGSDNRFQGKGSINKFNKNTQISFLGGTNNINERNFSFQDYLNMSGGLSGLTTGNGLVNAEGLEGLATGGDNGVTTATSSGINFNHDFNENTELSSSYFFNRISNDLDKTSLRQNFLNGVIFNSLDTANASRNNQNHRLSVKLKHKIGDGQDLTFKSNFGLNTGDDLQFQRNQTFDTNAVLINQSENINDGNVLSGELETSLLYRRKLNDLGRSLITKGTFGYSNSRDEQNVFANTSIGESESNLNQFQESKNDEINYELGFTLTEPIGKGKFLSAKYSRKNFDTDNKTSFFDFIGDSRVLNDELSQFFRRDYYYNRGGLQLQYNTENLKLTLGSMIQGSVLKGVINEEGVELKRDFTNILPSLNLRYTIDNSKHTSITYNTSVTEPSIQQLQPVVNNANPLRQYLGNPNLKVEYNHDVSMNFSLFDSFSFTSLFVRLGGRLVKNKITNTTTIAADLTQIITPINIDEEWVGSGYTSFGTSIKPLGIKLNVSTSHDYTNTQLFINDSQNEVNRWTNSIDIRMENRKKRWYDLSLGYKTEYSSTRYSQNIDLDQDYYRSVVYSDLSITIKKNWVIVSSFDYRVFDGNAFGEALEIPIWRASISRAVLKNDRGELKLSVFDILEENQGISRSSNFNYIQDQRVNTVTQYFMLSFTYNLSKFGSKKGGITVHEKRDR